MEQIIALEQWASGDSSDVAITGKEREGARRLLNELLRTAPKTVGAVMQVMSDHRDTLTF